MSSKKKADKPGTPIDAVLGVTRTISVADREFRQGAALMGEVFLFNRIVALETRMESAADLDDGLRLQQEHLEAVARFLTGRAVDGKPVTPEWVGGQQSSVLVEVVQAVGEAKPR